MNPIDIVISKTSRFFKNQTLFSFFLFLIPLMLVTQVNAQNDAKLKLLSSQVEPGKTDPLSPVEKEGLVVNEKCGTMMVMEMMKKKHAIPPTEQFEQWMEKSIQNLRKTGNTGRAVVTIPVVIHIIHDGSPIGGLPNITDAQALTQIDVLNEDFNRLNPDAGNTPGDFLGVASNPEIQFCLATVDPNGAPTTGINRYNGGQASYSIADMESDIKPSTIWHPDFYFNIWCAPLQGGLLGYAQFPDMSGLPGFDPIEGPSYTDGIVVRDLAFGRGGSSQAPFDLGRTTTHEAGHFFGLRHIGGDGNCSADDYCADTPTQDGQNNNMIGEVGEDGCVYDPMAALGTIRNDCDDGPGDLPDQFMNYMDYTDDGCMNLFTADQKLRFDAVLSMSPRRLSLTTSMVCNGVQPNYPYVPFPNAPANDLCGGAQPIGCGSVVMANTDDASPFELPEFCGTSPGGPGIWYTFTGDGSDVTLSLCGSGYDTKINVYTGSCNDLTCVTGNDDDFNNCGFDFTSQVSFCTTLGSQYYVYISGFNGATGDFGLSMICNPPPPAGVANDFITDAIPISCGSTIQGTTIGATTYTDGLGTFCGTTVTTAGVWYTIVGAGGIITLSTCNDADYDTKINVFLETGICDVYDCVAGNDDGPGCSGFTSEISFEGDPGVTYYILVSGFGGATGNFNLSVVCPPPPPNNLCMDAILIDCYQSYDGSTLFATTFGAPATDCEVDAPLLSDDMGPGVWYYFWAGASDNTITLSTCNTADYDTKIDVFTGDCDNLVCHASNEDGPGCANFTSELTFPIFKDQLYYVYVSGYTINGVGTSRGNFSMRMDCAHPIPTLSEWGLIILSLLIMIMGVVVVSVRRRAIRVIK